MPKEREILRVWPSAIPRIIDCTGAAYPGEGITVTQPAGEAARAGSAIHDLAGQIVRENLSNCPDATGYAVDHDVLGRLKDITTKGIYAAQMWGEIRGEFDLETVQVEQYAKWFDRGGQETDPIIMVSGYRDVCGLLLDGVSIGIVDWKSGMADMETVDVLDEDGTEEQISVEGSDSIHQLKSYALQALDEHPDRSLVKLFLGWLNERYYLVVTYTREEILAWWDTLQYRIRSWDGKTYSPGQNCRWCPRAIGCPGREKYMGVAVKVFGGAPPVTKTGRAGLALNDPRRAAYEARLSRAYDQCKSLESHIEIFKANLKQEIAAGGPIPDGNGKAIALIDVKGKAVIGARAGWETMKTHLLGDEEALHSLAEISLSTLKRAVKDLADKGEKTRAVERLIEDLEHEKAVIYKPGYQRFGMVKDTRFQPAIDI